jgi:hypothetical protein
MACFLALLVLRVVGFVCVGFYPGWFHLATDCTDLKTNTLVALRWPGTKCRELLRLTDPGMAARLPAVPLLSLTACPATARTIAPSLILLARAGVFPCLHPVDLPSLP